MFIVAVAVIMGVWILCWSDVLHLDDVSALGTALDWALAGDDHPELVMGICWNTGAADVVLVAERLDHDWVLHGSYSELACGSAVQFLHPV
jgi:hypothetical protein